MAQELEMNNVEVDPERKKAIAEENVCLKSTGSEIGRKFLARKVFIASSSNENNIAGSEPEARISGKVFFKEKMAGAEQERKIKTFAKILLRSLPPNDTF